MFRHTILALAVIALLVTSGSSVAAGQREAEVLSNESIVAMSKAGIPPSIIVSKIRTSAGRFNTDATELVRLKSLGIANDVLEAMMASPALAGAAHRTIPAEAAAIADAPANGVPSDPGIYVMDGAGFTRLESNVYSRAKTGGIWKTALTYGIAKAHYKAVISGSRANLQVSSDTPTFYFRFEPKRSTLGEASSPWQTSTTSPNEFQLLRLDVRKNGREVVLAEANAYGSEAGAKQDVVVSFEFKPIERGLYSVTPRGALAEGEYCFSYSGATVAGGYGVLWSSDKVFDFGVRRR